MFINETKVDLQLNLKMNSYMTGKKAQIMLLAVGAIILCCGMVTLMCEIMSEGEEAIDLFFPVFCFAMSLFMIAFASFYKVILKMSLKKLMQGKESLDRYTFTEDGYEKFTTINDGTTSTARGDYSGFTEAKEYKDMLILFINKSTVFPLTKSGMVEGSWEELTSLVNRKLGDRYKVFCKLK